MILLANHISVGYLSNIPVTYIKVVHTNQLYIALPSPNLEAITTHLQSLLYLYLLETSLLMEETLLLNKQWQVLQWNACHRLHCNNHVDADINCTMWMRMRTPKRVLRILMHVRQPAVQIEYKKDRKGPKLIYIF